MTLTNAQRSDAFGEAFTSLTGNPPFPWQRVLYDKFAAGDFPDSCSLPTGLGKTSIIAIWLIALSGARSSVPRRLVYVVNRRTVVDQSSREAEKVRERLRRVTPLSSALRQMCAVPPDAEEPPLAISTLRGEFADNREWSADPARPAIIVGTVDMIGSRLLFGGYGVGFKAKPLHAGFLGQDVLLVHDEAHLEPAFQALLTAIQVEQKRCDEFGTFRVMALSATSRGGDRVFGLTPEDHKQPEVRKRISATKTIRLHESRDAKKLAEQIGDLAVELHQDSGRAVLVFVRRVDDVEKVVKKLPTGASEQLTGTLRGLERDGLVKKPIFQRFLPESDRARDVTPAEGTVYLVCTSAGEVGANLSADHMVCDLSTFDSMAQRLGRVNRFGNRDDTRIDVVAPKEFDAADDYESRLNATLALLEQLHGDGSPAAIDKLDGGARIAAFAPAPTFLPTSDILFDAWALTTIRDKLPGRPPVEPYLHGLEDESRAETFVAWREEVGVITDELLDDYDAAQLLADYAIKPHERLRDSSSRVFDRLKRLKAAGETPVWIVSADGTVEVTTLGTLIHSGKEAISYKTVLLPPSAGGLENGMLSGNSESASDVADEFFDHKGIQRRVRVWKGDPAFEDKTKGMRPARKPIKFPVSQEDEDAEARWWHWFELPRASDSDGSTLNLRPVWWTTHTDDVVRRTDEIVTNLRLPDELRRAFHLTAMWHDLGKRRPLFQRILGNTEPGATLLAKSGKNKLPNGVREDYRHEFGSLVDVLDEAQAFQAEFRTLPEDMRDLVLHLIASHHGRGRPHFPQDEASDPEATMRVAADIAAEVPRRFARLQRRYGRWGLAYLESLLRAADRAASAEPSSFVADAKEDQE